MHARSVEVDGMAREIRQTRAIDPGVMLYRTITHVFLESPAESGLEVGRSLTLHFKWYMHYTKAIHQIASDLLSWPMTAHISKRYIKKSKLLRTMICARESFANFEKKKKI